MASLFAKCIECVKCRRKDKPVDQSDPPPAQLSSSESSSKVAWEGEVHRLEALLAAMGAAGAHSDRDSDGAIGRFEPEADTQGEAREETHGEAHAEPASK